MLSEGQTSDGTKQIPVQVDTTGILQIALTAGSAVAAKVSIDQTTPGTTDSVTVATGQGAGATIGVTTGAAVTTDANGTVQQYLRGLLSLWSNGLSNARVNSQSVAVTTSGAGYVSGDVVGGILSLTTVNFATGRRVSLRSLQINDKGGAAIALNVYFFKATPAAGTYTDNAALAWGTGDSANKVGQVKVAAADWITDNSQSSVNYTMSMKMPVAATTLFMLVVAEASATFTNGNFTMDLEFDQE